MTFAVFDHQFRQKIKEFSTQEQRSSVLVTFTVPLFCKLLTKRCLIEVPIGLLHATTFISFVRVQGRIFIISEGCNRN